VPEREKERRSGEVDRTLWLSTYRLFLVVIVVVRWRNSLMSCAGTSERRVKNMECVGCEQQQQQSQQPRRRPHLTFSLTLLQCHP